MKKIVTVFLTVFFLVNAAFIINEKRLGDNSLVNEKILATRYADEYMYLLKKQKHLNPDSPAGIRVNERINKIIKRVNGGAKADRPDEFVRILEEMRIPYGETKSSYPMNYKIEELKKAISHKKTFLGKNNSSVLDWIERGPGNVSGRARGLIVDPGDASGNTWFVGSVGGGLWKTTDGGANWRDLAPELPNLAVSTLAMSASNPDILYAGTGESMFSVDVINGDGILKSTDRGETWFQLNSTIDNLDFNNIARIIVDPSDPDVVLAATTSGRYRQDFKNESGIFKSTDGGTTWYNVYNEMETGSFGRVKKILHILETPGNFNILYAGVDEKGILKSTDAGETWFKSSNGITDSTGRFELAVSPVNPNKIFAASEGISNGNPSTNLFVSTDAGNTWAKTTENGSDPNWLSSQGWYDNTIAAHPFDENIVYVGGVEIFQVDLLPDNKRKTTPLETGPVHVDQHNLVIIPGAGNSFRILNANDGGIGVSANGSQNWSKPTLGMNTSQFYGIDKKPGASAYVGGMQDNGTWRSNENATASSLWNFQIGGDGYETSWHFDDPDKIIGGYQFNGFMRSLDGGFSYSNARNGLSDVGSGKAPFISKIGKTNMEPDLLFTVGSGGVWKSTNFGGNWTLTAIPSSTWGSIGSFHDVEVSRANPNIVWAGSRMDAFGKIVVSTDKGASFTATPVYSITSMGGISGLSTHPVDDSTAYVLFSFSRKPKILRTTNLGQTWEDISGFGNGSVSTNGFPDVAIYDLMVFPHTPDTIWAGTEIGLFESTDNGSSWHIADNGMPNVCIWDITHVEDEVILGTHGRGIWTVKIPEMTNAGTFKPLIKNLSQGPDGQLAISINLRSLYDSTNVKVNGNNYLNISANAASLKDTVIEYPVTVSENLSIQIVSYKNGDEYASVIKNISVSAFKPAQNSYSNSFNVSTTDFVGTGFQISGAAGFDNNAIHSPHPYSNNQNLVYTLTIPIIISSTNAFISFDEIVLIEPGDPGSVFGDDNFWDYVIVEGSKDGLNWIPLKDGYDSRANTGWLNSYNANQNGSPSLYKKNTIDLLNSFSAGDQILIRFRLYADGFVTGWGWAIDNLEIQENLVNVNDRTLPSSFALAQNYPNPFNPVTTINYQLPEKSFVTLKVFDGIGREVATLVNEEKSAGTYQVSFNSASSNKNLASGIYFYRIEAVPSGRQTGSFTDTKKFVLLK